MDQVQEVKNKVDIVSIIGEKVKLNKAGKNYKGLCPFHSEKSPSFIVSPDIQIYKCFGCGESGDVFNFLEKYESIGFYEALKFLAEKTGTKLKSINQSGFKEKEMLFNINLTAANFYHYILTKHTSGKNALNYAENLRRIDLNTINTFKLGFAPNVGNPLVNYFRKKNIDLAVAQKAGVVAKSNNRYFDRFHGRLVFPQYDKLGNVIGLAGRLLPEYQNLPAGRQVGKYVNSPETPIYNKSQVLYGYHLTKNDIKKIGSAIVVEGEVDMLSLWQAGYKNVVAIKGTALTIDQIKTISRTVETITLALDSDFAGNAAAKRGIELAHQQNLDIYILINQNFKDPDEFVKKDPQGFRLALDNTVSVWDFLLDLAFADKDLTNSQTKAKVGDLATKVLKMITDPILQADYTKKVARRLDVPVSAVSAKLGAIIQPQVQPPPVDTNNSAQTATDRYQALEASLLSISFNYSPELLLDEEIWPYFISRKPKLLLNAFLNYAENESNFHPKKFAQILPSELFPYFSEIMLLEIAPDEEKELVKQMKISFFKQKLTNLSQDISRFENKKLFKKLKKAQQEFTLTTKLLKNLQ